MTADGLGLRGAIEAERDRVWQMLVDARDEWPFGIDELVGDLETWLDGETVAYLELGWDGGEHAYSVRESRVLWAFALTSQFALLATVDKQGSRDLDWPRWQFAARRELVGLSFSRERVHDGRGLKIAAEFRGIDRQISIPSRANHPLSIDERRELFRGLRADLFVPAT